MGQCILIVFEINADSIFERTNATGFCKGNDACLIGVAQNIGIFIDLGLKYIVFHSVVSSFRIVFRIFFVVCVFNGLRNHRVNNGFLFFRKRVEYVCDGFLFFLALAGLFLLIRSVRSIFRMIEHNVLVVSKNDAGLNAIAMSHDGIDKGSGICPSQNQTHFTNSAVNHIAAGLLQLIGKNRKRPNVAMTNGLFDVFCVFSVVERTVGVNAFVSVLQQRMTKNIIRIGMVVVPNQRNSFTIAVLECIFSNGPSIRTEQIVSSGPATKIIFLHFDFPPGFLFAQSSRRQVR